MSDTSTVHTETPVVQKKSNKGCIIAIILGLLLAVCLCCCALVYLLLIAPLLGISTFLLPSTSNTSISTVRPSEEEIEQDALSFEQKIEALENLESGSTTVTFTEEELLASLYKNADLPEGLTLGLEINDGYMDVVIPVGDLYNTFKNSPEFQNSELGDLPLDLLNVGNMNISVRVGTSADHKSLTLESISTGNPLIDGLLEGQTESFDEYLSTDSLLSEDGDFQIDKIQFREGEIVLEVSK